MGGLSQNGVGPHSEIGSQPYDHRSFNRPSVRVSPDWDAGGGVTGGKSTHPHPKGPAQHNANILALALPDRQHHGPRYKIFAWCWPPSAGPQPSQRTEPWTFCLCDATCSRPHSCLFKCWFLLLLPTTLPLQESRWVKVGTRQQNMDRQNDRPNEFLYRSACSQCFPKLTPPRTSTIIICVCLRVVNQPSSDYLYHLANWRLKWEQLPAELNHTHANFPSAKSISSAAGY